MKNNSIHKKRLILAQWSDVCLYFTTKKRRFLLIWLRKTSEERLRSVLCSQGQSAVSEIRAGHNPTSLLYPPPPPLVTGCPSFQSRSGPLRDLDPAFVSLLWTVSFADDDLQGDYSLLASLVRSRKKSERQKPASGFSTEVPGGTLLWVTQDVILFLSDVFLRQILIVSERPDSRPSAYLRLVFCLVLCYISFTMLSS